MDEAIKLAIEKGGYEPLWLQSHGKMLVDKNQLYYLIVGEGKPAVFALVFQDPLFWQALSRALGWSTSCISQCPNVCRVHQGQYDFCNNFECLCHKPNQIDWKKVAHQYFDLLLTGGDTSKFWKELLNQ